MGHKMIKALCKAEKTASDKYPSIKYLFEETFWRNLHKDIIDASQLCSVENDNKGYLCEVGKCIKKYINDYLEDK